MPCYEQAGDVFLVVAPLIRATLPNRVLTDLVTKAHRALGGKLCNRWQQLAGQMIFGYESVDTLQDLLGNLDCSR